MKVIVLFLLLLACTAVRAELIQDFAELESILGDAIIVEDYEGFSLAGGTSISAPNPLNSSTKPEWGLQPAVTYSSTNSLRVYTGQLLGDDSNILGGVGSATGINDLTIAFDNPQLAAGFYLVNITGNLDYSETVTFYRNSTVLGFLDIDLPRSSEEFIGWHDSAGITSAKTTSDAFALVDNVTWGVNVPEPSSICLLGIGLVTLILLRHPPRKGKNNE